AAHLARWPDDAGAPDVLYEYARVALGAREGAAARRRLEDFIERYPAHTKAAAALYLLADTYQDDRGGKPGYADQALALFDRIASRHSGSQFADRAYMRAAHLAYALGRYAEAERRYAGYRGSESQREARYWLARASEKQGKGERAREIYRSLGAGNDYYALRSRARLDGAVGSDQGLFTVRGYRTGPPSPPARVAEAILVDPAARTASLLLALGERSYARAELERAVTRLGRDPVLLAQWATALDAWGFPGLTLQIGVRLGAEDAGRRFAYPAGFADAIDAEARAHGLDAGLVLALIRQESLFRADAVSPVGARGLMQVMPATGAEIAGATGWSDYDPAVLFDPAVGLHFGAHYLAGQLDRFDGFWPAVLAAYNGGPHNVAVWWSFPERTLDAELWIDRIPYKETREYVKKVLTQYAAYRRLYPAPAAAR
ncbi:MAG: lytic transglycosylase domain-containing protein, partial [Gemmatimonadetes bacterium]|nr:lytic transglycosylase domain-containing protein [Gemmatimonadota bacterium]